jgi:WD40 repeat protein
MLLEEICTLIGHSEDRVWHVSWHPKGTHLASCGEDTVVRIWSSSSGDWTEKGSVHCICTLEDAQTRTVRSCEWSPNGRQIACASFDGTVVVWEARDSSLQYWDQVASLDGHTNEVKGVAWSPVGFWVATCGRDKKIWIWEQEDDFVCVSMLDGHTQDVKFVTWHPSEQILFSGSYDDTIKIWQEDDDEFYCCQTLESHEDTIWGISLPKRSRGDRMVSCCADGSVKLWESDSPNGRGTWREVHSLKGLHRFPCYSIHWGAHYIATGGGDNDICLLEVVSEEAGDTRIREVTGGRVKQAHQGDVNCVRFGPYLEKEEEELTDGDASTAKFEAGMKSESVFRVATGGGRPIEPDMVLASCGDDGTVKLWRLNIGD